MSQRRTSPTPPRAARPSLAAAEPGRWLFWEADPLDGLVTDTLLGRGGVRGIEGGAGVGKSELLHELGRDAAERGAHVLWGRAWRSGGAPPLWPWLPVLGALSEPRSARSAAEPRTLHLLRPPDEPLWPLPPDASPEARFQVLAAAARVLTERAAAGPVLVLLDDLHAADEASVLLLELLEAAARHTSLGVVATWRRSELPDRHARALGAIPRLHLVPHGEPHHRGDGSRAPLRCVGIQPERRVLVWTPSLARPAAPSSSASASPPAAALERPPAWRLTRDGEHWRVERDGRSFALADSKGVGWLARLVEAPARRFHVLDLASATGTAAPGSLGDAGELLDARAREAYVERAHTLREQLEDAEERCDLGAMERARAELALMEQELGRAFGLGGRARRAGAASERARVNVQRRLRSVVERIERQDPALGRHLSRSLRTGVFCCYAP